MDPTTNQKMGGNLTYQEMSVCSRMEEMEREGVTIQGIVTSFILHRYFHPNDSRSCISQQKYCPTHRLNSMWIGEKRLDDYVLSCGWVDLHESRTKDWIRFYREKYDSLLFDCVNDRMQSREIGFLIAIVGY